MNIISRHAAMFKIVLGRLEGIKMFYVSKQSRKTSSSYKLDINVNLFTRARITNISFYIYF